MPELNYAEALRAALDEEMARDERVFLMGEDIAQWGQGGGIFGVTRGLVDKYGLARVRDTPISEEGFVAVGVGAALTGMRPVVELMYVDFVGLAMEPIVNQAAKLRYMFGGKATVPLVIRAQEGTGRGSAAQHSQSLEAWFLHIPGLKVVVPSTPYDAKGLLKTAIRDDNPVIFLEHKLLYLDSKLRMEVPADDYTIPFGQADIKRPGRHVTVVGVHTLVHKAIEAAEVLAADGIELEVIDPRTLVPLDVETIARSVKKTNHLLVCHEAHERGGVAGEIAMALMDDVFDYLDAPIVRLGSKNCPVPYNQHLERAAAPQVEDIVAAVRGLLPARQYAAAVAD
ncbi:MAG: alpha-ketoacid dehydrogenase subunit beta [Chloroflexi bacterium]|nr:alpha-ketoacid dehydrogenase subunit beta [Chloroflexota bacterium]